MKGHREAVGFVANLLDQLQHGRVTVKNDRFIFLAENVEDFFLLGDAGRGLIDDLQGFQSLGRGVKLAQAAIGA